MTSAMTQRCRLRLYISGQADTGRQAALDVRRIFDEAFDTAAYTLDVIDVREQPELAEEDNVLATPTLIRKAPPPQRRLIGEFADLNAVLTALDIHPPARHGFGGGIR